MKPRDITIVIDQMLALTPAEFADLRRYLAKVKDDAGFTAPEAMSRRWWEAGTLLQMHLTEHPHEEGSWQRKVCDVFMDKAPS